MKNNDNSCGLTHIKRHERNSSELSFVERSFYVILARRKYLD